MSKFIQLEYGWYDDQNRVSTGMVIINLDMVMVDNDSKQKKMCRHLPCRCTKGDF